MIVTVEYIRLVMEWVGLSFAISAMIQLQKEDESVPGVVLAVIVLMIGLAVLLCMLWWPTCHAA